MLFGKLKFLLLQTGNTDDPLRFRVVILRWFNISTFFIGFAMMLLGLLTDSSYVRFTIIGMIVAAVCYGLSYLRYKLGAYALLLLMTGLVMYRSASINSTMNAMLLIIILVVSAIIADQLFTFIIFMLQAGFVVACAFTGVFSWHQAIDPSTGLYYANTVTVLLPLLVVSYIVSLVVSRVLMGTIRKQDEQNRQLLQAQKEIQESGERISQSLREKEVLLREIHHRVKNNLQVIISLLNLQSQTVKESHLTAHFADAQGRIRAMSLVHEWLYRSEDLSRIDLGNYLGKLVETAGVTWMRRGLRFIFDCHPTLVSMDRAIPCALIANELITNSTKYAFTEDTDNAEIRISTRRAGRHVTMVIADNGAGMPAHVNEGPQATLGLQLVATLVTQIGGTSRLDVTGGTCWTIEFDEINSEGA